MSLASARRRAALVAALLTLYGCATTAEREPAVEPSSSAPFAHAHFDVEPARFEDLPGWDAAAHAEALGAFLRTCSRFDGAEVADAGRSAAGAPELWRSACKDAAVAAFAEEDPRAFFERRFEPLRLSTAEGPFGKATAYYEPELEVRARPEAGFDEPLLAAPKGLRAIDVADPASGRIVRQVVIDGPGGAAARAPERRDLTAGAGSGAALAWGRVDDVVFLQIQGSGRVRFPDGASARAAYGGHNGHPYVSIARILIDAGELPADGASNAAIRRWLRTSERARVAEMLARNARYVFFDLKPIGDPSEGPVGAALVPLTSDVSIAVDPDFHAYGALYYLSPAGPSAPPARLAVAQDTGGAIKGPLRVDLFFGTGDEAGARADVINHAVEWWALAPRAASDERLASR